MWFREVVLAVCARPLAPSRQLRESLAREVYDARDIAAHNDECVGTRRRLSSRKSTNPRARGAHGDRSASPEFETDEKQTARRGRGTV